MPRMTVAKLIALLEDMPEDAEVRLATQPNWPLQHHIKGVAESKTDARGKNVDADEWERGDEEDWDEWKARIAEMEAECKTVVYIVEGGSVHESPYAPREVFERY